MNIHFIDLMNIPFNDDPPLGCDLLYINNNFKTWEEDDVLNGQCYGSINSYLMFRMTKRERITIGYRLE